MQRRFGKEPQEVRTLLMSLQESLVEILKDVAEMKSNKIFERFDIILYQLHYAFNYELL